MLYGEDEELFNPDQTMNTDAKHDKLMEIAQNQVINTDLWNPLHFAIFYGRLEIVKYIFGLANEEDNGFRQHIYSLLCDTFKLYRTGNEDEQSSKRQDGRPLTEKGKSAGLNESQ